MQFNLFESKSENSYLYLPVDQNYNQKLESELKFTSDLKLVFTCEAKKYSEAMQKYYDFAGFGTYILEDEDIIYNN